MKDWPTDLIEQIDALLHLNKNGCLSQPIPALATELLEKCRARLTGAEPQTVSVREAALEVAAEYFIAKVDRGEARSKDSYAAFKAALALPRPEHLGAKK